MTLGKHVKHTLEKSQTIAINCDKTALTISLDLPCTLTHVHLDALQLACASIPFHSLYFLPLFYDQYIINFDWFLCMNDVFGTSIPFLISHDTSRYRSSEKKLDSQVLKVF